MAWKSGWHGRAEVQHENGVHETEQTRGGSDEDVPSEDAFTGPLQCANDLGKAEQGLAHAELQARESHALQEDDGAGVFDDLVVRRQLADAHVARAEEELRQSKRRKQSRNLQPADGAVVLTAADALAPAAAVSAAAAVERNTALADEDAANPIPQNLEYAAEYAATSGAAYEKAKCRAEKIAQHELPPVQLQAEAVTPSATQNTTGRSTAMSGTLQQKTRVEVAAGRLLNGLQSASKSATAAAAGAAKNMKSMVANFATWHKQRTEQKAAQSVGKQEQQAGGRQHEGIEQQCRAELHSPEPRMMEAAAAAAEGARTKNACPSHFHASEATMNCIGSSAYTKVVSHAQLQTRAQRYANWVGQLHTRNIQLLAAGIRGGRLGGADGLPDLFGLSN